jgi:hypothetical protein
MTVCHLITYTYRHRRLDHYRKRGLTNSLGNQRLQHVREEGGRTLNLLKTKAVGCFKTWVKLGTNFLSLQERPEARTSRTDQASELRVTLV